MEIGAYIAGQDCEWLAHVTLVMAHTVVMGHEHLQGS